MIDPDDRKVEIVHGDPCRCRVDGEAVYVAAPCYVLGVRLPKHRLAQILHSMRGGKR